MEDLRKRLLEKDMPLVLSATFFDHTFVAAMAEALNFLRCYGNSVEVLVDAKNVSPEALDQNQIEEIRCDVETIVGSCTEHHEGDTVFGVELSTLFVYEEIRCYQVTISRKKA